MVRSAWKLGEALGPAGGVQHRPGRAVHGAGVDESAGDGRRGGEHGWSGPCLDNVFVERLWRSVKYEDIYIYNYELAPELESGLRSYFWFYDEERPHQSPDYRTPGEVHRAGIHGG